MSDMKTNFPIWWTSSARILAAIILAAYVLTACTPAPVPAPATTVAVVLPPTNTPITYPATWTPAPTMTPSATRTLVPTWTPEATSTLLATMTPFSLTYGTASPDNAECTAAPNVCQVAVQASGRRGWCELGGSGAACSSVYDYTVAYPRDWTAQLISDTAILSGTYVSGSGIYSILGFDTDTRAPAKLYELPVVNLGVGQADQVKICKSVASCRVFVSPHEELIRRQVLIIDDLQVLNLITHLRTGYIVRYFSILSYEGEADRMYILELRVPHAYIDQRQFDALYQRLVAAAEEVIVSIARSGTQIIPNLPVPTVTTTPAAQ